MTPEVIVLVMRGKGDGRADYAEVYTFSNHEAAQAFCEKQQNTTSKYWTRAEIVVQGESVELDSPHNY